MRYHLTGPPPTELMERALQARRVRRVTYRGWTEEEARQASAMTVSVSLRYRVNADYASPIWRDLLISPAIGEPGEGRSWERTLGPITIAEAWHVCQKQGMELHGISARSSTGEIGRVYLPRINAPPIMSIPDAPLDDWRVSGIWRIDPETMDETARRMGYARTSDLEEKLARRKAALARSNRH